MTQALPVTLAGIFLIIAIGWVVQRRRWLGGDDDEAARILSDVAFVIFIAALLFRTMAPLALALLPA
jgi:hypothetical protein